jgi:hypothetical protein
MAVGGQGHASEALRPGMTRCSLYGMLDGPQARCGRVRKISPYLDVLMLLMMYSKIIAVCSQIHTKHINTLCRQNVPRSEHSVSVIKTSQLMLYSKIIAVCSQVYTKHIQWSERTAQ